MSSPADNSTAAPYVHPYASNDDLVQVRATLEWYTNSSPFLSIDWAVYEQVRAWCAYPDKLSLVISTLTARLKSPAPSSYKALILLQAVPTPSLIPLIDDLQPLAVCPKPSETARTKDDWYSPSRAYIALMAGNLLATAEAEKTKAAEEDAKSKWGLWSSL